MGFITQHAEIISKLKEFDAYNGDEFIVYATLKTSKPLYVKMNYLNIENYIVQGAWLCVSNDDIKILPVTQLGKLQNSFLTIPKNEVSSFEIKKNLLLYTISITDLKNNTIQFKVAKKVVGNKSHQKDFAKLLKKYT